MLSKNWTIKKIKDYLRVLINELAPDKIQELALDEIIFLNLTDLVEMLNGASAPDYGVVESAMPINGRIALDIWKQVNSLDYNNGIVRHNGHGLTQADIGRFALFKGSDRLTNRNELFYTNIVDIIDANFFKISPAPDYGSNIFYTLFGKFSDTYIDLSNLSYGIDRVIKVVDSMNNLLIPVGDFEFNGLRTNTLKQNNVFYNHFGDRLLLYKGTNVGTLSTLTIYYYRQPIRWSNDNNYIDLKDKYVNLLIAKCKNSIYEFLKLSPPEALANYIESKTQAIRQLTLEESQIAQSKQNKSTTIQ